jgi:hypothetical protein
LAFSIILGIFMDTACVGLADSPPGILIKFTLKIM